MSRREKPQFVNHTAFDAVIFDMDGVITDTARLHEAAWKRLFDEFLSTQHSDAVDVRPFSPDDYRRHVDGRARIHRTPAPQTDGETRRTQRFDQRPHTRYLRPPSRRGYRVPVEDHRLEPTVQRLFR